MKPRQILRKCVITRKVLPRNELFRIARAPDGTIMLDTDGKSLGRGMYVSRDLKSIEDLFAPKRKGLWKHALKEDVSSETQQFILTEIRNRLSTAE